MTLSFVPYVILALAAGFGVGLQAVVNARLGLATGNPFGAALVSFVVGTAALAALVFVRGDRVLPVAAVPWWTWIGGALGAFYIVVAAAAVPRIGPTLLFLAVIFGQVTTAFIVERLGAFGIERRPTTALQLLGYALVVLGFVLIRTR